MERSVFIADRTVVAVQLEEQFVTLGVLQSGYIEGKAVRYNGAASVPIIIVQKDEIQNRGLAFAVILSGDEFEGVFLTSAAILYLELKLLPVQSHLLHLKRS